MPPEWSKLKEGDRLAAMEFGPVTRTTLALFAGGSGDHNPLHIDSDFARAAGFDDVIAHGMLSMAYLGRYLQALAAPGGIRSWSARFLAPTPVGVAVRCWAEVTGRDAATGVISLVVHAATDAGVNTIRGYATLQPGQDTQGDCSQMRKAET